MSRNHGDSVHNDEEPIQGDDFKVIKGIGPSTEAHLHNTGILTYAQLAALSPADIVALISNFASINAERIIKQDWIGQAQIHAAGVKPAEPETEILNISVPFSGAIVHREVLEMTEPVQAEVPVTLPIIMEEAEGLPEKIAPVMSTETENPALVACADSQANFLINLKLDESRQVLQTYVRYVQNQKEETWSGWEPERLLAYVQEMANLTLPTSQSDDQSKLEPEPISLPNVKSETIGQPVGQPVEVVVQPQAMTLLVDQPNNPDPMLRATQPCQLHLTLDLDKRIIGTPIEYDLYVYASVKGANTRLPVCKTQGSFHSAKKVQLEATGKALPPGFYHLEGIVTFTLPSQIGRALPVKVKSSLLHFS